MKKKDALSSLGEDYMNFAIKTNIKSKWTKEEIKMYNLTMNFLNGVKDK